MSMDSDKLGNAYVSAPSVSGSVSSVFAPPVVVFAANASGQGGGRGSDEATAAVTPGGFDSAGGAASDLFREGLRRIAAPPLPPKIQAAVAAVHRKQQHIRGRFANQRGHLQRRLDFLLGDFAAASAFAAPTAATSASVDWNSPGGVSSHGGAAGSSAAVYGNLWDNADELSAALQLMMDPCAVPVDQQEESMITLDSVSRMLPPSTQIDLPVILLTLRPLLLPKNGARPVHLLEETVQLNAAVEQARSRLRGGGAPGTDSSAAALDSQQLPSPAAVVASSSPASALFYDPFAARRERDRLYAATSEVVWPTGCVGHVVAVLTNPLGVSLHLDSLSVLLSGPKHIAYKMPVDVPPYCSRWEVRLEVKPLEKGELCIRGLLAEINNASAVIPVDALGTAKAPPRYQDSE
jgi:hypothetical protein